MTFLGDVEFVEGRRPSQTAAVVLGQCLGCGKKNDGKEIEKFLLGMSIKPDAFFRDIDADWSGKPFIGQHVFKVAAAAGYEGTENELWLAVTGNVAPYAIKKVKAQPKKAVRKVVGKSKKTA